MSYSIHIRRVNAAGESLDDEGISVNQDENSTWTLGKEGFLEQRSPRPVQFVTQVYPAWSALLQNGSITFPFFTKPSDLVWPFIELRLQVVRLIQEILRTHVNLGDRYIQIRAEVEKIRHTPNAKGRKPNTRNESGLFEIGLIDGPRNMSSAVAILARRVRQSRLATPAR